MRLLRQNQSGLWVTGPRDEMPAGALRRARGVHRIKTRSIRSRWGQTALFATAASVHSITRFNGTTVVGAGTELIQNGVVRGTGFDGSPLAFVTMPPTLGKPDYLFMAGGGLPKKLDAAGVLTEWGLFAPPDGFTATKAAQSSKTIDLMESAATWTASGGATAVADEGTIKQEGANSMKMTVPASTLGYASKAIAVDLSTYGGGVGSPDEDFIALWVRVDNPSNLKELYLIIDVGAGDFATNTYSRTIRAAEQIPPSSQTVTQTIGIGQLPGAPASDTFPGYTTIEVGDGQWQTIPDPQYDPQKAANDLGQVTITTATGAWIRLRVPKSTFQRNGNSANGWANVAGVRLGAQTTSAGQVIIYWDEMLLIGSTGMQGTYKYRVTFRNSTSGHRSNANATPVVVENVERQGVNLANLPIATDTQVNQREIWRTVGGGERYFKVGSVDDNVTTTFADKAADYPGLDSIGTNGVLDPTLELVTDNDPPASTYEDIVGPYLGRVWWGADSAAGAQANLYYSPAGRPEAVQGFIVVSSNDDPYQRAVVWNSTLWVFTRKRLLQVIGDDEPFTVREVYGVPGTNGPRTVIATPHGILYQADDGVRLFNGTTSALIASDGVSVLWNGEAAENLAPILGQVATYGHSEYVISDTFQTLALNVAERTWRDLGFPCFCLAYADDVDPNVVIGGDANGAFVVDAENVTTDRGAAIPFEIETPGVKLTIDQAGHIARLYVEADTSGQPITPTLVLDDDVLVVLPPFVHAGRRTTEWALGRFARIVSVRLAGSLTMPVEVIDVSIDLYDPRSATLVEAAMQGTA